MVKLLIKVLSCDQYFSWAITEDLEFGKYIYFWLF